jgi:hypothetical protein
MQGEVMTDTDREALIKDLPRIAEVVNKFESEALQIRAFDALLGDLDIKKPSSSPKEATGARSTRKKGKAKSADSSTGSKKKSKSSAAPSIDKNLNFRPSGEKTFEDYVAQKAPRYANERSLVAAMWLREHSDVDSIGVDQIYSAFRDRQWKVPANLGNHLQVIASKKGWLDTQNMTDIKVTVQGENYVLHELPPDKGKS